MAVPKDVKVLINATYPDADAKLSSHQEMMNGAVCFRACLDTHILTTFSTLYSRWETGHQSDEFKDGFEAALVAVRRWYGKDGSIMDAYRSSHEVSEN